MSHDLPPEDDAPRHLNTLQAFVFAMAILLLLVISNQFWVGFKRAFLVPLIG